jgi:hypothetical protein
VMSDERAILVQGATENARKQQEGRVKQQVDGVEEQVERCRQVRIQQEALGLITYEESNWNASVKELILQLKKRRLTWNASVKELGIPGHFTGSIYT